MNPFAAATLGGLVLRGAARNPGRAALWVDGGSVSYRELLALAAPIAHALIAAGCARGSARCAVLGGRTVVAFAGILGAQLARCAYVPLNPAHPHERISRIIREADIDAIVVAADAVEQARGLLEAMPNGILVLMPDAASVPGWAAQQRRNGFLCRRDLAPCDPDVTESGDPDEGAYLLYTSGSTGAPKGILVRNRNVMAYLRGAALRYAPGPDDRMSQLFDLTFDLSVHDMFLCWGAGATLYCPPARARFAPHDFVRRHELTTWFSVPSTVAMMAGLRMLRPGDFPALRLSLFCGEALPKRLALAWAAAGENSVVENLYGPTEATIAVTAFRLPADPGARERLPEVIPIGSPLPGQHTAVVSANAEPVAAGETGELCLAGTQVTDGYWRRPDLTAERFARFPWDAEQRLWYRTGDRVRMTAEHGLEFLGRLDRQVKIAGYRVELDEVEAVLQCASGGRGAALAWPAGGDGLARGIAAFVGEDAPPDAAILDACRRSLPPYALPAAIHRLAEWPVNSNGKTDHGRLRRMLG